MKYRVLGNTGLYVSELCFGTMTFGGTGYWEVIGKQGQGEADELVGRAIDAGINFFDTADIYAFGESERLLGKALAKRRDKVVIATKLRGRMSPEPNDVGLSRAHILASIDASLRRLGTEWVDLYQIHGFDAVTPLDETLRALDDVVRSGKVRYIGCSNLAAWQLMKALGISERDRLARFQSLQAYYTIAGRDLEREIVPLLRDQHVGLLVWSPLAGGFLTGKFSRDSSEAGTRRATFDFPPIDKERAFSVVDAMKPIAKAHDVSVATVALGWLLSREVVSSVIIGAKSRAQLDDNLRASGVTLTADELRALDQVSALPPEYPGWMLERQGSDRVPAGTSGIAQRQD